MVGVARSKGCRICVQRRVKCDQTRPVCNNCLKGNRPCPGYDTDLRIHDESSKLRKRFGQQAASDHSTQPDRPSPSTASSQSQSIESSPGASTHLVSHQYSPAQEDPAGYRGNVLLPARNAFVALLENQINPDFDLLGLEPPGGYGTASPNNGPITVDVNWGSPLNGNVYSPYLVQEQLLSTFSTAFTTTPTVDVLPAPLRNHTRWLSQLPAFFGTTLLDTAVRAVSLVHLGRIRQIDTLVQESRQYYGKALQLLARALKDEKRGMATETLSATILLSFYEMLASDSNEAWVRHAGGAGTLMRIRGPKRHLHGMDRDVYLAYRHTIVIEAFQRDEACFLAEPEWIELAEQIHQELRTSSISPERMEIFALSEEFFRENVHIPGTFKEAMKLPNVRDLLTPAQYAMLATSVLDRCKRHRAIIKSINMRIRATLERLGLNTVTLATDDPVVPVKYVYVNVFIASTQVGSWTILLLLNLLLKEMEKDSAPEMMGLYLMENLEMAREICRSTSFMMASSFLGPFFVTFGLRLCLMVFDPGAERDWVVRQLIQIGATRMKMASDLPRPDPEQESNTQILQAATPEQMKWSKIE